MESKTDSCDSGAGALTRMQHSPLVVSLSWTWGGTSIGTGQVTDAYHRADFWQFAKANACCVLGHHDAYTASAGVQTYGLGMYDNSGAFLTFPRSLTR